MSCWTWHFAKPRHFFPKETMKGVVAVSRKISRIRFLWKKCDD